MATFSTVPVAISIKISELHTSVLLICTCSQKEHILHHTGSGSHVVCDHTGLVQYNLGDTNTTDHCQRFRTNLCDGIDSVCVGVVWPCCISTWCALIEIGRHHVVLKIDILYVKELMLPPCPPPPLPHHSMISISSPKKWLRFFLLGNVY